MSHDPRYPFPQVFLVDSGGGGGGDPPHSVQPPGLIPCWSFPPAQERARRRGKRQGCMGVSPGLMVVLLLILLLVFAAMGLGAYQIYKLQRELIRIRQDVGPEKEVLTLAKQVGSQGPKPHGQIADHRPAAHVLWQGQTGKDPIPMSQKTLRWRTVGLAFAEGGVAYRAEDGGLQVNHTGLYHIYSRVELLFKNNCGPKDILTHTVFVRRAKQNTVEKLMDSHREGFCRSHSSNAWTLESYLASALHLEEHDRVFVNVSHPSYLSHQHDANFFGLYKI